MTASILKKLAHSWHLPNLTTVQTTSSKERRWRLASQNKESKTSEHYLQLFVLMILNNAAGLVILLGEQGHVIGGLA